MAAARAGRIVLFGMRPRRAETAYGYIEVGDALEDLPGVRAVARFVEKPNMETAAELVASGRHLWNSGMFVFTAQTLLAELERFAPDVLAAAKRAVEGRVQTSTSSASMRAPSPRARTSRSTTPWPSARTAPPSFRPTSAGATWEAGTRCGSRHPRTTRATPPSATWCSRGASGCFARSDGILTAVVGLQDAVVVVTADAVLAMHRDRAQDVKRVVDRLKAGKRHEAVAHNRSYRPWGFYESLIQGDRFQVKRIVVNPGQKLSLQKHYHRAEHWVVVHGIAPGDARRGAGRGPGEREHLPAARLRAPHGEPGAHPAHADRGAERQLPRRGRHHPARRHIRAQLGGGRSQA